MLSGHAISHRRWDFKVEKLYKLQKKFPSLILQTEQGGQVSGAQALWTTMFMCSLPALRGHLFSSCRKGRSEPQFLVRPCTGLFYVSSPIIVFNNPVRSLLSPF